MNCDPLSPQTSEGVALPSSEGDPVVVVSPPVAGAIRSLGWELCRLAVAGDLLNARWKRGTLTPPLMDFLSNTVTVSDGAGGRLQGAFSQRFWVCGKSVRLPWKALEENGVSACLLALFHLPALRSFWSRALRRSHYERLCRELPRAWFVTDETLPAGAVIPGLGITSWDCLPAGGSFVRTKIESGEVVIDETPLPDAIEMVATYERVNGRVVLNSVA